MLDMNMFLIFFSGGSFPCWTENKFNTPPGTQWAQNSSSWWRMTCIGSRPTRPWLLRQWHASLSLGKWTQSTTESPIIFIQVLTLLVIFFFQICDDYILLNFACIAELSMTPEYTLLPSPDGARLAYFSFDDTDVSETFYTRYGDILMAGTTGQISQLQSIRFPQVSTSRVQY